MPLGNNSLLLGNDETTNTVIKGDALVSSNLTVLGRSYLGSTNSWLSSDGTNLFFRNVNGVTNALSIASDAPAWIAATNTDLTITITNDMERPQYLYATGAVSLAFSGLRPPQPVYLVISGPDSVAFPAGTHFIGGATWQTNQQNHFLVWQYSTNLYVNPITTSTEE